jgi:hypothetical protein
MAQAVGRSSDEITGKSRVLPKKLQILEAIACIRIGVLAEFHAASGRLNSDAHSPGVTPTTT